MKRTRTVLLICMMLTGFHFQNCTDPYFCECGPSLPFFYVNGFELTHYSSNISNNAFSPIFPSDTININDYAYLELDFEAEYVGSIDFKPRWYDFNISTITSAYGCSCALPGGNGAKEEGITSLDVITVHDFNEEYSANDTINDIIEVHSGILFNNPESIVQFVNRNADLIAQEINLLKLKTNPTASDKLQLKLSAELSNGERYEVISEDLNFVL